MRVETVTEGGRRFVAGNKGLTRLDIASERERQRDWESCYRAREGRTCEATPIVLVD